MRIKPGIQPFLDILNNRYILAIPTAWDGDLYNLYSLDLEQLVDFTEFYTFRHRMKYPRNFCNIWSISVSICGSIVLRR